MNLKVGTYEIRNFQFRENLCSRSRQPDRTSIHLIHKSQRSNVLLSYILVPLKSTLKKFNIQKICFVLIIIYFTGITVSYSLYTPTFEGGDEKAHYENIKNVFDNNFEKNSYLKSQPLSYLTYAVFLNFIDSPELGDEGIYINDQEWPKYQNRWNHGIEEAYPFTDIALTVHLLRIVSIVAGIVTIIFVYKDSSLIFTENKWLPVFTMAFVASIPKFAAQSSTLTNDSLVFMFSTIVFYFLFKFLNNVNERKNLIFLSIFTGIAILTKSNAMLFYPVVLLSISYLLFSKQIGKKVFLKDALIFLIISLPSLIWIIINFKVTLYKGSVYDNGTWSLNLETINQRMFEMNWSWLGSHIIQAPHEYLIVTNIITVLAISGLFLVFVKKEPLTDVKLKKGHVLILFSSTVFMLMAMIGWLYFEEGGDIKYTYPIIGVYGILFSIGLYVFVNKKYLKILLVLPIFFLVSLNVSLLSEIDKQWYHGIEFYKNPFIILNEFYYSRSDLQKTFPEVKENNLNNYLIWVKNFGIHEHVKLRKIEPIVDLIQIYESKNELQEKFPEVKSNNEIKNLLKWSVEHGIYEEPTLAKNKEYFTKYYKNVSDIKN